MISPLAWIPFLIALAGLGNIPSVVLITVVSFFATFGPTLHGIDNVPPSLLGVAYNLGYKKIPVYLKVVLPMSLPTSVDAARQAFGIAWYVVIAAEMLGAQSGLGYLITVSRLTLSLDTVAAVIIIIGVTGVLFSTVIDLIALKLFPWREQPKYG